jgi:hypothetical protein
MTTATVSGSLLLPAITVMEPCCQQGIHFNGDGLFPSLLLHFQCNEVQRRLRPNLAHFCNDFRLLCYPRSTQWRNHSAAAWKNLHLCLEAHLLRSCSTIHAVQDLVLRQPMAAGSRCFCLKWPLLKEAVEDHKQCTNDEVDGTPTNNKLWPRKNDHTSSGA